MVSRFSLRGLTGWYGGTDGDGLGLIPLPYSVKDVLRHYRSCWILGTRCWSVPYAFWLVHSGNQQTPSAVMSAVVFVTFRLRKRYVLILVPSTVAGLGRDWAYHGCRSVAFCYSASVLCLCLCASVSVSAEGRGEATMSGGSRTISDRRRCAGRTHDREDCRGTQRQEVKAKTDTRRQMRRRLECAICTPCQSDWSPMHLNKDETAARDGDENGSLVISVPMAVKRL